MQKTFLFYDLETTGLNLAFDQPIQFAAIRTDLNLNEIERYNLRIKLRPDVIPSPYAVITHLLSPQAMQEGLLEVDAIRQIHQLLNQPGTISLGYNTLGYDDEMLRFSFYRNLLPPYTHQYANQCYRADIFPITILFYLYSKQPPLHWPKQGDKVSLKLDQLNATNQLATGQAHDALVDVEATIALAKRLMIDKPRWNYCFGYFNKQEDAHRLDKLEPAFPETNLPFTEGLFIHSNLGYANAFQAPVLCLGQHRHYRNQFVFLRLDLAELRQTTLEDVSKTTWTLKKKLGEPGFTLPAKERFLTKLSEERLTHAHENKAWLVSNPEILTAITDYYLDYKYPLVPNADVDSVLYQTGFLSPHDEKLCRQYHQTDTDKKAKLINQFHSTEAQELALRLLGRNYPETLNPKNKAIFEQYLQQTYGQTDFLIDYRNQSKFNLTQAELELEQLKQRSDLTATQRELLQQYKTFLETKKDTPCATG